MNTVVGIFDYADAQRAIKVLEDYGVDHDQISMVARDINMVKSQAPIYAFTAPEFGPVIATGGLGIELFVTLETRATGSLSDALMNIGFSEADAELYVEGVKRGDVLLSVESGVQDESLNPRSASDFVPAEI